MLSKFGVLVADAGKFTFGVLKGELLGAEVLATDIDQLLGVGDSGESSIVLVIKLLNLILLVGCFMGLCFVGILKVADLTEHLSTLNLNGLDFTLKIGLITALVGALVALGHSVFSKASSLKVLLIKQALGSCAFVIQTQIQLGPKSIR